MIDSYYDCFKRSLTDTARIGLRKQQPATRSRVAAPIASERASTERRTYVQR